MKTIKVTTQIIRCGTPGEMDQCPIAIALRPEFPGCYVAVMLTYPERQPVAIVDDHLGRWMTYPLPAECRGFIEAFDEGQECEPFSFPLYTRYREQRDQGRSPSIHLAKQNESR